VYASQLIQAEGLRYGVEHWRRNRTATVAWARCTGSSMTAARRVLVERRFLREVEGPALRLEAVLRAGARVGPGGRSFRGSSRDERDGESRRGVRSSGGSATIPARSAGLA
jgi:hypothetical protein